MAVYQRHKTRADRGTPGLPKAIPAATWQAGVTPGNERLRVLLDGEPAVGAIAANEAEGWVVLQPEPRLVGGLSACRDAPLGIGYRVPLVGRRRRTGRVQIVPGDRV